MGIRVRGRVCVRWKERAEEHGKEVSYLDVTCFALRTYRLAPSSMGSHLSMVWCIWMTYRILFHLSGLGCRVERCETEHIRQVHDFSFSNGRHQIFIRRRIKLTLIGLSTSPV